VVAALAVTAILVARAPWREREEKPETIPGEPVPKVTVPVDATPRKTVPVDVGPEKTVRPKPPRRVLHSSLAGKWYTADPALLSSQIAGFLDDVEGEPLEDLCALILPHAGYRWSGPTAAWGLKQIAGRSFRRVIVIGPSHSVGMENVASIPDATHYATPLGEVPLDVEFLAALRAHACFQNIPAAHQNEHSVQIEVPLLQKALGEFQLVPIVVGSLDRDAARAMAKILAAMIDPETFVIASSDFTHYGSNFSYLPFRVEVAENLKKLDMEAFAALEDRAGDAFPKFLARTRNTICGRHAVQVLLDMLGPDAKTHLLKYDTSGRISGDFSNSVSYLSIAFTGSRATPELSPASRPSALTSDDRRRLLLLARKTLKCALEDARLPAAEELGIEISNAMREPRGAFVTLHKDGQLRGCIGALYPTRPLFRTVMAQALSAALRDRRFRPVAAAELPALDIEISVLTQPKSVASREEIVIGRHGIILRKDGRSAVFLPQVAPEQGWDLPTTLGHLSRKAGLLEDAWKNGASFKVFEADVFAEPQDERGVAASAQDEHES